MSDNVYSIMDGYVGNPDRVYEDFIKWSDSRPDNGMVRRMLSIGMYQAKSLNKKHYRVFVYVGSESDMVPSDRHPEIRHYMDSAFRGAIGQLDEVCNIKFDMSKGCSSSIFCREHTEDALEDKERLFESSPRIYERLIGELVSSNTDPDKVTFLKKYGFVKEQYPIHEQMRRNKEDLYRQISRQSINSDNFVNVSEWDKKGRRWMLINTYKISVADKEDAV